MNFSPSSHELMEIDFDIVIFEFTPHFLRGIWLDEVLIV